MRFNRISLKLKINLVLGLFLASILLCWGSFYLHSNAAMEESTENLVTQVSGRVSDLVSTTFLYLEHTAVVLSSSQDVSALLQEDMPLTYYTLREDVVALADSVYQPNGLVDTILLYDTSGNYCRLRGDLGNTSAVRLGYLLPSQTLLQHGVVTLEGETYLNYAIEVVDNNGSLGYVVFLMNSARLQAIFESYDTSGLLSIALVADDAVISGVQSLSSLTSVSQVTHNASTQSITPIGSSPFSILVWDDGTLHNQLLQHFIILGTLITVFLLILLVSSYQMLQHIVFSPLLKLMDNAKKVELNSELLYLEMTGQAEFDALATQINQLIVQLEDRTKATLTLERTVQAAQLERQTAIITSLKKQINAHFTVNTLTVIRRLNQLGETEKVGHLSKGLAYLLRYAYDGDESIACMEELFVLEKYITMMQIRYPNRFTADLDIDAAIEDIHIPRMLLQPLLENAIVHGFANATDRQLTLWGHQTPQGLHFVITDNGCGIAPDIVHALQQTIDSIQPTTHTPDGLERVALVNIQKRIVTEFGLGYGLSIQSSPTQGTVVELTFPSL